MSNMADITKADLDALDIEIDFKGLLE